MRAVYLLDAFLMIGVELGFPIYKIPSILYISVQYSENCLMAILMFYCTYRWYESLGIYNNLGRLLLLLRMQMVRETTMRVVRSVFQVLFVLFPSMCVAFLGLTYLSFIVSFEDAHGFCWAQKAYNIQSQLICCSQDALL